MTRNPDCPYAAHRAQTDQALGGMACWAVDPLETRQIAQPVRPARWQVVLGVVVFVGAIVLAVVTHD